MEAVTVLERYAELRNRIETAEAEIASMKDAVVEALTSLDGTYAGGTYKLSLRRSKKWAYTNVVHDLEAKFKGAKQQADQLLSGPKKELAEAKKHEEKSGVATLVETTASPMYKSL